MSLARAVDWKANAVARRGVPARTIAARQSQERTMRLFCCTLKLPIIAAALVLGAASVEAQQKAPQTTAPKAAPKAPAKSACNQISDETKCKAETTCSWIAALTDSKTGKQKRKAYCRTKSKPPAKKAKDASKT